MSFQSSITGAVGSVMNASILGAAKKELKAQEIERKEASEEAKNAQEWKKKLRTKIISDPKFIEEYNKATVWNPKNHTDANGNLSAYGTRSLERLLAANENLERQIDAAYAQRDIFKTFSESRRGISSQNGVRPADEEAVHWAGVQGRALNKQAMINRYMDILRGGNHKPMYNLKDLQTDVVNPENLRGGK